MAENLSAGRRSQPGALSPADIARLQQQMRQVLATGTLPTETEITVRAQMVNLLLNLREDRYLQDAIQHLVAILHRLRRDSPDRPKYLNDLSAARMSEYLATNTRHTLDQAVLQGREAKEMAATLGLRRRNPMLYVDILNNFGFALSRRYADLEKIEDLEEAIVCAREAHENAPNDSKLYHMTLNNLASRLRLRYRQSQNAEDIDEALKLIAELRATTAPNTSMYAVATGQLGMMSSDRFERTNSLQDLDEALGHCKSGFDSLPEGHEAKDSLLANIVHLYSARYEKTSEITDLRDAGVYSGILFCRILPGHTDRGRYLSNFISRLHKLATMSPSLEGIQSAIRTIQPYMNAMPSEYPEKRYCCGLLADLFIIQYCLSKNLQDLIACVNSIEEAIDSYNHEVRGGGSSKGIKRTTWLRDLRLSLQRLCEAPPDNKLRILAEDELSELMHTCHRSESSAPAAFGQFYSHSNLRLEVLVEAIAVGRTLSIDEIASKVAKLKEEKAGLDRERQERRYLKDSDYQTIFGVRKLAIDEGGNLVLDLENVAKNILGYDVTKRYSVEEFAALEAQAERKAIDAARRKGRHPNIRLCRMCRDITKLLRPIEDGFELTAKDAWFPFGNFHQLPHRKHCSICSLILWTISTRSGALLPQLEAMDPEVQGVRLSTAKLSTNEKLMRFDYGMKHVGELRIITPQNFSQALRQAWQMDTQSMLSEVLGNSNSVIYDKSQQQTNLGFIKSWLNNCDNNHGLACNHPWSTKRVGNAMNLTLIDVKEERLVSVSSDVKYFALSYVWGEVDMSQTIMSNYEERCQLQSLAAIRFPKTISDAIRLVRLLGERYLWVDAICLVQDDKDQMIQHISNMDIVYGHAFATIVALNATDANVGLAGVCAGTREPQKITTISVTNRSTTLDDDPDDGNKEIVHFTATPRPLHLSLGLSRWNSRGWIVQERLLSRRCIFFAPDAVYVQCGQETLSEGGANENFEALLLDSSSLSDSHILENANRNNPLSGLKDLHDMTLDKRLAKAFNAYAKLVGIYSERDLSFKSDILKAFAGMFAVLQEYFQSETIHGLPAAIISHALLWSPATRLPRRGSQLPKAPDFRVGGYDPQFPSWSWIGWDGPVEYRVFERVNGEIILPTPSIKAYDTSIGPIDVILSREDEALDLAPQTFEQKGKGTRPNCIKGDQDDETTSAMNRKEPQARVVAAKLVTDRVRSSTWFVGAPRVLQKMNDPYMPAKMLRFTARTVPLRAFQVVADNEYLSNLSTVLSQSSQAVRRILDHCGRHCGLWWQHAGYGYVGLGLSEEIESKIDLLEVSRYGNAYRRRDGPSLVHGPISIFDNEAFPATGPGSGLVNVLVTDPNTGHPDGIVGRCTVATIHATAWEAAEPREKEIRLI